MGKWFAVAVALWIGSAAYAQDVEVRDHGAIEIQGGGGIVSEKGTRVAGVGISALRLKDGGVLRLGPGASLAIGDGTVPGTLSSSGSPAPTISTTGTEGADFYVFDVASTGTLAVSALQVLSTDLNGVTLAAGSTIDNGTAGQISGLTFDAIQGGGTFLRFLHASGAFEVTGSVFNDTTGAVPFNISTPSGTSPPTLKITASLNNSGPREGSAFENDHGGGADVVEASSTIVWQDELFPKVTGVSATTADGAYGPGVTIAVTVTFNVTVNVIGTPQLTLETGAVDAVASFASGSGSATLTFNYLVADGENSTDLDYVSQTALALNGGTIKSQQGNDASLTLPTPGGAGSLGANKNIVIDTTKPTVTVTPDGTATNSSPITFTLTFSEPVTGLAAAELVVTNGTASNLLGAGAAYTVDVTPSADGPVTCQVAAGSAQDAVGNGNVASNVATVTFDTAAPTVSVTPDGTATNASPIQFTIAFSESVTGLTLGEVVVTNGAASNLSGSGATYTVNVAPSANGAVTCKVAAGAAQDAAGNGNVLSNNATVMYDTVAPTVSVTPDGTVTSASPIQFTIAFSESVTGLTLGELVVSNGTASNLVGSGTTYSVDVTPLAEGTVTCQVVAGAAQDAAGNGNMASNTASVIYDVTPPTLSGLAQFKSDGKTGIVTGGTTNELTVVFRGTVNDSPPGQMVKLQVELKPVGMAFSDAAGLYPSAFVAGGSVAAVTVSDIPPGSHHWRARAVNAQGNASSWSAYGGNTDPGDADFTVVPPGTNASPDAPIDPGQFRTDGISPLSVGATTNESSVILKARVTDPDGDGVKLAVEVKPIGTAFTGVATAKSPVLASGTDALVEVSGLPDDSYHWQAWTVDSLGAASGTIAFVGNPDFVVSTIGNQVPSAPAALGQFRLDGTTSIGAGASTPETGVVLQAKVSDPDWGQSVKLQVELKPLGTPFDGSISATSGFVAPGSAVSVTVGGLVDGAYRWRCRTLDSAGGVSDWTDFGGGSGDFSVDTSGNSPPLTPSALTQIMSDGTTVTPAGGATVEPLLIFQATVTDPDGGNVRLQAEIKPVGVAFDGASVVEGDPVASGGIATVTLSGLPDGAYHWRVRAVDSNGSVSPWMEFNDSDPAVVDITIATLSNTAPDSPSGLAVTRTDGQAIGVGGTTNESTIELGAIVGDSDETGGAHRLQVEVQPVGTPFTGTPTATGDEVGNGVLAILSLGGLTDGIAYHWQARTIDANGVASAWVPFGGNGEGESDFGKVPNSPPPVPSNLNQLAQDGTPIPLGAKNGDSVKFSADLSDPDGDNVRLEVELRPVGFAFTNGAMSASDPAFGSGSAELAFDGLSDQTGYHWQARAIDSSGAASDWVSFGGNGEEAADFTVDLSPPAPSGGGGGGCGSVGLDLLGLVGLLYLRRRRRRR